MIFYRLFRSFNCIKTEYYSVRWIGCKINDREQDKSRSFNPKEGSKAEKSAFKNRFYFFDAGQD